MVEIYYLEGSDVQFSLEASEFDGPLTLRRQEFHSRREHGWKYASGRFILPKFTKSGSIRPQVLFSLGSRLMWPMISASTQLYFFIHDKFKNRSVKAG